MVRRSDIIKGLKEYRAQLQQELGEVRIIFFGSYRRNKTHKDSDVDLVIVSPYFHGMKSYERSRGLQEKFRFHVPMDIICLTPEEYDAKRKRITIIAEAAKEGLLIT